MKQRAVAIILAGFTLCAIAFGLYMRLEPLTHPIDEMMGYVHERAFVQLEMARNWNETGTPTFDGVRPGAFDGFLYGIVLNLVLSVTSGNVAPVKGVLLVFIFFDLITAILIGLILYRLGYPKTGLMVAGLWMVSPFVAAFPLSGTNATMAGFLIAAAALCLVEISRNPGSMVLRIVFGLVAGIGFLGEAGQGIFMFSILTAGVLTDYFVKDRKVDARSLVPVVTAGGSFGLYALWAALKGIPLTPYGQKAMAVKAIAGHEWMYIQSTTPMTYLGLLFKDLGKFFTKFGGAPATALLIIVVILWIYSKRQEAVVSTTGAVLSTALGLATGGLIFWSAALGSSSPHYFWIGATLTILIVTGVLAAASFEKLTQKEGRRKTEFAAVMLLVLALVGAGAQHRSFFQAEPYFWQRSIYGAISHVESTLPDAEKVASFHPGMASWFLPLPVVDLTDVALEYDGQNAPFKQIISDPQIAGIVDYAFWLNAYEKYFPKGALDMAQAPLRVPCPVYITVVILKWDHDSLKE